MKRSSGLWAILACGGLLVPQARAAEDAPAIVARGIAALGGEAKLGQVKGMKFKTEGKLTIQGEDNNFTTSTVTQGIDHVRSDVQGEFNGNEFKVTTVLDGKKGWRTFPDSGPLDADAVDNERRNVYLQVVPVTLVPLLTPDFKIEAAGEEKVNDKPASVVKVTGPDGKTCRLMFDKESGLPARMVATVAGWGGDDYEQTTTFLDYKETGGIRKAMKVEVLRDGSPFLKSTIKDFEVLAAVPAGSFDEPK